MVAIEVLKSDDLKDGFYWKGSSDGKFTIELALHIILHEQDSQGYEVRKATWTTKHPKGLSSSHGWQCMTTL